MTRRRRATYDYVIVGAGSAGCVLANRLSAPGDASVLLLEAGGSDRTLRVQVPAAFSKLFRTGHDWGYSYESEPGADGRSLYAPRGRMLGGSSSLNAMIYMRGNRADYDDWAASGATGWSYAEVLPYFRRAEHNERGEDAYHGVGGPLNVADQRSPNPVTRRFLDAAGAAGLAANPDFNGSVQWGAGLFQVTQKAGRRWSAADAYLRPAAARPSLTVRTGALVTRIVLERGRAVGVELLSGRRRQLVRVAREVLLAAGAFNSPQLLMLSGIGPADHLRSVGIPPVIDHPHVGGHLQDHPAVLLSWEVDARGTLRDAERPASLVRYLTTRSGLLSSPVAEAGAFLASREGLLAPDLQLHMAPGFFADHGFVSYHAPAVSIGPTLVAPQSRGRVRLRSARPTDPPMLTVNALAERVDVDTMIDGMERVREIAAAAPLAGIVRARIAPSPGVSSRRDLEAYLRQHVELLYHPSCSARIGPPEDGVVDPALRVHGVSGLRVVDASVMPTVVRGNTNAPTIMIAERAADLLLQG
jgi:choline dehydrogenase-like flavoprotein